MLKASDVMTRDVITITPEAGLMDAVKRLVEHRISGMPVCTADGRVVGMISEKDILNFIFSGNIQNTTVREAMSTQVISYPPETPLDTLSLVMAEKQIRRIPIIAQGKLAGVVSRRSIIRIVLDLPGKI